MARLILKFRSAAMLQLLRSLALISFESYNTTQPIRLRLSASA